VTSHFPINRCITYFSPGDFVNCGVVVNLRSVGVAAVFKGDFYQMENMEKLCYLYSVAVAAGGIAGYVKKGIRHTRFL